MLDYHRAVCARPASVERADLAGVWAVQTVFGSTENELEGVLLMRFEADGTYAWDPDGALFAGEQAAWGTYQIHGRLLVMRPEGGYFCGRGEIATWRPAVDDQDGVLTMVWRRICPDEDGVSPHPLGPHAVWIARRVLPGRALPAPQ